MSKITTTTERDVWPGAESAPPYHTEVTVERPEPVDGRVTIALPLAAAQRLLTVLRRYEQTRERGTEDLSIEVTILSVALTGQK